MQSFSPEARFGVYVIPKLASGFILFRKPVWGFMLVCSADVPLLWFGLCSVQAMLADVISDGWMQHVVHIKASR